MFAIIVTEKGGEQRRLEFDKSEVTIGRVQGNDVILPKGNVSKRHARIVLKDGKFIIVDLKSTNGTYVNGRKITSPLVVKDSDKIYIGDFILGVDEASVRPSEVPSPPPPAPPPPAPPPAFSPRPPDAMPAPPSDGFAPRPPDPMPPPASSFAPPRPSDSVPPGPMPNRQTAPAPRPPAPMPAPGPGPMGAAGPPLAAPPIPEPPPAAPPLQARPSIPAVPERPRPEIASGPTRKPDIAPPPVAAPRPAPRISQRGVPVTPLDAPVVRQLELQDSLLKQLVTRLELDAVPSDRLGDEALWQKAESALVDLVESLASSGELPGSVSQDGLIKETLHEALGLGPLEGLMADEAVDEIIVDRRDRILVSRGGTLSGSGKGFSSDLAFRRVVERLVAPTGHELDDASPLVDLRLRDGSRLSAAMPPVAVRGACLVLRKPRTRAYSLSGLIGDAGMSSAMGDFLTTCVAARRNIVVCGASGAGKSAMLAALAASSPAGERVVTVEDVAELSLGREEWVALEARPGDGNGVAPIDLDMVLRSALRMRADRLVVGEVRGAEVFALISAMASSVDGAMVSVAGDGARAALARLAVLAQLGLPGATTEALRHLVASAVDVVVHVARYADGVVRIASIEEVVGVQGEGFETREVFAFRGSSAEGQFAAAGVVPAFYSGLAALGIDADTSIFRS